MKDYKGKIWEGVFSNFSEANGELHIFEDFIWKDKVINRAKKLQEDSRSHELISNVAITSDYALPFVASTLIEKIKIKILDFGGGLGTSFIPLKAMLAKPEKIKFTVVENKSLCALGNEFFKDDAQITFVEDIPKEEFDIVHAGSSIHYIDNWQDALSKFAECRPEYIVFADLPAGDIETFVTAQTFHGKRIPVRFWNLMEFNKYMQKLNYELIFKSRYVGYYMDKESPLPNEHFSKQHRLNHFCQLIFRRTKKES